MMKRLVLVAAALLGGCICEPSHHTETAFASAAQFEREIGECGASASHCAPLCAGVFGLAEDQIEACKLGNFDESGAWVTVHYVDDGVCSSSDGDDGTWDDGSWDDGSTDDGTWDDGSTDDGSTDDGSTDDGSTDDGSTDDGSTDDGSTDDGSTDDGGGDWKRHAPTASPIWL